jgi:hypothetical protein
MNAPLQNQNRPVQDAVDPLAATLSPVSSLLRHGTHLVDLVLSARPEQYREYRAIMLKILDEIEKGGAPLVNEKFDGSPAIVLGFTADEKPFIAYKGGFSRKGPQALITDPAQVRQFYRDDSPLGKTLAGVAELLLPKMAALSRRDLLLQGDLLFLGSPKPETTNGESAITIRANPYGISYRIAASDPMYERLLGANVGLVVHSQSARRLEDGVGGSSTRVAAVPMTGTPKTIIEQAEILTGGGVLTLHPFRNDVPLGARAGSPLSSDLSRSFRSTIDQIGESVVPLTEAFQERWKALHPKIATYLNSELYPGRKGGLYRAAADGESFDQEKFLNGFTAWISLRQNGLMATSDRSTPRDFLEKTLTPLLTTHGTELNALLRSYFEAVALQYRLKPYMAELYRSKLGGGPAEGVMFGPIKLVDRLEFTIQNFAGTAERKKGRARASLNRPGEDPLPAPLERWRSDTIFYVGKFQPLHAGHVEVIRELQRRFPDRKLVVLASEKEPNLAAKTWKESGLAERKGDIQRGALTHVFKKRLRSDLFKAAFRDSVEVKFLSASYLWEYLRRAQREGMPGSIGFAIGEKELTANRYQAQFSKYPRHLQPVVVDPQESGLSATQVRKAIAESANTGNPDPLIDRALSYLPDRTVRDLFKARLERAWADGSKTARRVTKPAK